jgi:hypothetical protein
MTEPMTSRVEVWPVAADAAGIWLLSGDDAWRPNLPVPADSEPHAEVELTLAQHGATEGVALIHSTSWRVDGPSVILTYVAVIRPRGLVLDEWPRALPVSAELADAVGRPLTHGPTEVPIPRFIDVLIHSLRHLAYLRDTDATSREAIADEHWRPALAALRPTLAGMYETQHRAA